jgi:hypothetical protein
MTEERSSLLSLHFLLFLKSGEAAKRPRTKPTTSRSDIRMIRDMLIFQKKILKVTIPEFWRTRMTASRTRIMTMINFV